MSPFVPPSKTALESQSAAESQSACRELDPVPRCRWPPPPRLSVATSVATSRSSITSNTSLASRNPDVLDAIDASDASDTRVTRLRAWSTLSGWRFESSSAHSEPPAQRAVPAFSRGGAPSGGSGGGNVSGNILLPKPPTGASGQRSGSCLQAIAGAEPVQTRPLSCPPDPSNGAVEPKRSGIMIRVWGASLSPRSSRVAVPRTASDLAHADPHYSRDRMASDAWALPERKISPNLFPVATSGTTDATAW
jgi:hypothetical protein